MKYTLLTCLFFFSVFVFSQKQLQPYTFSKANKKGETQTILIYASAESPNSITFTLKNESNETLTYNESSSSDDKSSETSATGEKKDIKFKVFPFTEVSFRKQFLDAIKKLDSTKYKDFKTSILGDEKENKEKEDNKPKNTEVNLDVRNIFQFFDALVTTAFQYDTEPVAGVLKYNIDSLVINKKTIQGISADFYFKKQAKIIRKEVIDKKIINEKDGFLKYIRTNDNGRAIKDFKLYHQNIKKGFLSKAKPKFKRYAIKKLKEYYVDYELKLLFDNDFKKYKALQDTLIKLNMEIIEFDKEIVNLENQINTSNKQTYKIREIESKIRFEEELYNKYKSEYTKNREDELKNQLLLENIQNELTILNTEQIDTVLIKEKLNSKELVEKILNEKKEYLKQIKPKRDSAFSNLNSLKKQRINLKNNLENNPDLKELQVDKSKFVGKKNELEEEKKEKQNELQNFLEKLNVDKILQAYPVWLMKDVKMELDFNDGFLEHMKVEGSLNRPYFDVIKNPIAKNFFNEPKIKEKIKKLFGKSLKFENDFPFGFSSKSDFADLYDYTLYQSEGKEKVFSLPVTNAITYSQRHQNDRLDFSPKDQVVKLPLDDPNAEKEIELKKEKSSKILNAKIFTDFNGFQEDAPNGIVQMEIEKLIPIWTKRLNLGISRGSNFGFANYVNFNLSWQKINNDDRELQVSKTNSFVNNQPQVDQYVSYLDLVRFENVSVGFDLNIASFDFPLVKTRLEINGGVHYGRISVIDDVIENPQAPDDKTRKLDETVNMIRLYPDFILRIRPEERFGGYLRFRPFRTIVPNNEEFFAVSSVENFLDNRALEKDGLHRYELGAYYTPSSKSDNKFFFRYRYTNTSAWETNGYSEIQIGYQIYLKF